MSVGVSLRLAAWGGLFHDSMHRLTKCERDELRREVQELRKNRCRELILLHEGEYKIHNPTPPPNKYIGLCINENI
jgi:hypothetical protein